MHKMKLIYIILPVILILINCSEKSENKEEKIPEQRLITKLSQEASKIVTASYYEIRFGEPVDSVSHKSQSYFKGDSVLILRTGINSLGFYAYISERDSDNILLSEIHLLADKVIRKTIYDYDENRKVTKTTEFDSTGNIAWRKLYKYDLSNKLVEEFHYSSTGFLWSKTDFEYDSQGNRIKEITLINDSKGLSSKYEKSYKYDERNFIISEYQNQYTKTDGVNWTSLSDYFTVYKYNKFDKIEHIIKKSPVNEYRTVFQYDRRQLYKYSDAGKVIEEIEYQTNKGEKEKIHSHKIYLYNDLREISESKIYNEYGELISYSKYEYEFPKRTFKQNDITN